MFFAAQLLPAAGQAGDRADVTLFSADISIASPAEIKVAFSFNLDTAGKSVKEFKLSAEPAFYQWSKQSLQCIADGDAAYALERVPRADGLTTLRLMSKRAPKTRSLLCQMSGQIDPSQVEMILTRKDSGDYFLSLPLPAATSRVAELRATVHFPSAITDRDVEPGELTSEEFQAQYFPSALTLTSTSIPPYQVRTIDVSIAQGILDRIDQSAGTAPSQEQISRFVGMKNPREEGANFSLVILLASLIMFILMTLRSRGAPAAPPFLIFPRLGGLPRSLFSLCLVMLYAVFTLSGVFTEAMVFLTCAVAVQLRRGGLATDRSPTEPSGSAPVPSVGSLPGLFNIRRAWGLMTLAVFLAAGTVLTLLAWRLSPQSAQNLGAAFLLCTLHLFFPQPRIPSPATTPVSVPVSEKIEKAP